MTSILKFSSRLCRCYRQTSTFQHQQMLMFPQIRQLVLVRQFHVSVPKKALPPLIALVLRPLIKVGAIIFGRTVRKWWQKLPQQQKDKIKYQIKSKMTYIAAGGSIAAGGVYFYYLAHIYDEPITKRKRFIMYNDSQMNEIAKLEFQNQVDTYKHDIVPVRHQVYQRVSRVATKILKSNYDLHQIKDKKWTITVVDRPEITNAFILPNGSIFLFTGMLNICTNDDQLAIVLSHEISHAVLSHMAENLSKVLFYETLALIPLIVFWAVLPDIAALFSQWLTSRLADIVIHLPFSRYIEKEADSVGLKLAAKACYDIREAPVFWAKMKLVNEGENSDSIDWLSTHPSSEKRQFDLSLLIPQA